MKRIVFLLAALVFSGTCAARGPKPLDDIPLVWKPTSAVKPTDATANSNRRIVLSPFQDARKDVKLIGENRERTSQSRTVTTKDDVVAFVNEHFSESLSEAGLKLVPANGDVTVGGEIRRFFVDETGLYEGVLAIQMWVRNRQGQTLWSGMVAGHTSRWGSSYSAGNYYEALSNSLLAAVNVFLEKPEVRKALFQR